MYRFQRFTFGLLLGLTAVACTKQPAAPECATGDEGCSCYPNDTCNGKALTCLSNLCVNPNSPSGGNNDGKGNGSEDVDAGDTAGGNEPKGNMPGASAKPGTTSGGSSATPGTSNKPSSTASTPASAVTPVVTHGKLSVSGRQLVNASGQPVQLRGVSTMWLNWDDAGYSQDLEGLRFMRDSWKLQLLRVAMGVDAEKAYLTNADKMKQMLYRAVDNAIELGVYVIIDWHDHDAHLHSEEAKAFFDEVSAKYHGVPNVLYETFNEPTKVSWSTTVKPYHEAVVGVIRKNDPDAVIILGSPHWDQDVDVAAADPVPGNNLMYSVHFYSCSHGAAELAKAKQAYAQNLPLFVTEWGASDADGGTDGVVCDSQAQTWLSWLDASKISWAAWKLDSCTPTVCDSTAFFKSRSVSPSGGWTSADLNGHAPFVVSKLKEAVQVPPITTTTPTTSLTTSMPVATSVPVDTCMAAGTCAAGGAKDCKDGALVSRDCTGCALLSCGTACCGGISAFGADIFDGFTAMPSIVKGLSVTGTTATLSLQFTLSAQMGAVAFALDKAYSFSPADLQLELDASGNALNDVTVSLENGDSGCQYQISSVAAGVYAPSALMLCWGNSELTNTINPIKQINVRADSLSAGAVTLYVSKVTFPL